MYFLWFNQKVTALDIGKGVGKDTQIEATLSNTEDILDGFVGHFNLGHDVYGNRNIHMRFQRFNRHIVQQAAIYK